MRSIRVSSIVFIAALAACSGGSPHPIAPDSATSGTVAAASPVAATPIVVTPPTADVGPVVELPFCTALSDTLSEYLRDEQVRYTIRAKTCVARVGIVSFRDLLYDVYKQEPWDYAERYLFPGDPPVVLTIRLPTYTVCGTGYWHYQTDATNNMTRAEAEHPPHDPTKLFWWRRPAIPKVPCPTDPQPPQETPRPQPPSFIPPTPVYACPGTPKPGCRCDSGQMICPAYPS